MRAVVGRAYNGGVAVQNLVDVYHDAVGLEELEARVTRPFAGLKVACYYGCLLTRPPKVTLAEDPEYPTHMDEVVEALGCDARRVELQDRLLRRLAGAHRAGHRATTSWRASSATPGRAAPRPSPWPARSAR